VFSIPPFMRRRTDETLAELAKAYRAIGILHAVSVIKVPLLEGDVAIALFLCDELIEETKR
jgi:hypothetical protein